MSWQDKTRQGQSFKSWQTRTYKCTLCGTEFKPKDDRFWQLCPGCGRRTAPQKELRAR